MNNFPSRIKHMHLKKFHFQILFSLKSLIDISIKFLNIVCLYESQNAIVILQEKIARFELDHQKEF